MPDIVQLLDDKSAATKKTAKEILQLLIDALRLEWGKKNVPMGIPNLSAEEVEALSVDEAILAWSETQLEEAKQKSRINKEIKTILSRHNVKETKKVERLLQRPSRLRTDVLPAI